LPAIADGRPAGLRILHLCQPTDGGTAVVVRDLVRAGVAAGDTVTVGCPSGGYLADWVTGAGAAWVEVPMTRTPSPRDLGLLGKVRRLCRDADVVHLHSSKAGAVGRLAAVGRRARRPRILFTPHGWSWYVGGRLAPVYRRFERWAARVTDVVTVVSAEELAAGRAVLPARTRIEVIENGVDAEAFTPDGPRAARAAAPLIVQVGRLSRQKGQDRSIRALARCADRTIRLRLVGDGPDAELLAALADDLGVADRVEFVGSADPRPHLRAADLVVLPSRWEGMSLVLLEAMATGAAVIATDCGDSQLVLGDAGIVIGDADGDDDALTERLGETISDLLASPDNRRELGRRARSAVESRFRLEDTVQRYFRLWQPT
jgi:glycosyltransferase involved in cell wall biosynthesis